VVDEDLRVVALDVHPVDVEEVVLPDAVLGEAVDELEDRLRPVQDVGVLAVLGRRLLVEDGEDALVVERVDGRAVAEDRVGSLEPVGPGGRRRCVGRAHGVGLLSSKASPVWRQRLRWSLAHELK
jgi:hypothetical protein